jgi:hypothetical protein
MKSKVSMMKTVTAAVVLATGISGIARADDSSLNPFSGDSYAYFNGGNLGRIANPRLIDAPSAWRQSNPNGLTYRDFAALGSEATANRFNPPVLSAAASEPTWRATHPNGTTNAEFAALGSQKISTRAVPHQTTSFAKMNGPRDAIDAAR